MALGNELQEDIFHMNSSSLKETVSKIELTIVDGKHGRQFTGDFLLEDFRFMGYEFHLVLIR